MSERQTRRLAVACPTCGTREELENPNEAVEMYERHRSITGHAIEWERADLDIDTPTGDVEAVVRALGDSYEEGIPVGVITAVMNEQEVGIDETLDELRELRMQGRLYEPKDDHLRHT